MVSAEPDRCDHQLDIGLEHEEIRPEECGRPTWEDHDRCVWHAEVDGKTADLFEDANPMPGDDLDGAYLKGANLVGVDWLEGTSLVGADLSGADLNGADLSGTNLTLATLNDVSAIGTSFRGANLEGAIFTNGDLRRATLADAMLDEAIFTDVHVGQETDFGNVTVYERQGVEPKLAADHPLEAAAWAYRQLQQLYRDNALPQLARQSYNRERDARRRLAWDQHDIAKAAKWELSRWVMLYGSSPYRVLGTALIVVLLSAVLYPITGGIQETQGEQAITYTLENPEDAPPWWLAEVLGKSLYFSVVTFATLGYGDIQPIGTWARTLAGVETIIGTLLSALLVFVLTRIVTW